MTLKLIIMAGLALAVFGAIWIFLVMPAEKRDHQRRMELVQRKLERHESQKSLTGSTSTGETEGSNP
jgi:hypothetical protein